MDLPKIKTFHEEEVVPILDTVRGPVDSFVVDGDRELMNIAVENGNIEPGTFRDCSIFGDEPGALEQKKIRYETKRAKEIQLILAEEMTTSIETQLMHLYVDQTMARAILVEAARKYIIERNDGTLTPEHERLYSDSIDRAQAELFPHPELKLAAYASSMITQKSEMVDVAQANELRQRYPFLEGFGEFKAEAVLLPETREQWRKALHERYDHLFDNVKSQMGDEPLSNATLAHATRLFMDQAGLPMAEAEGEGWKLEERENVAGFRVEAGSRMVICGRRRKEITQPTFERFMMHEIIIHATRAENGRRLGYDALQNGLPGYQEVEEGLGVLIEKMWSGEDPDAVGRDHYRYVAVCYADGRMDGQRHNETETLTFITDMIASQKPGGLRDDAVLAASRKTGYDHVKRAFRGMPEGKIMYSNLAYLSGKLKMMSFVELTEMSPLKLLEYLQQCKFNPMDDTHVALLETIKREREYVGV